MAIAFICRASAWAYVGVLIRARDKQLDREESGLNNERQYISTYDIFRTIPMIQKLTTDELVQILLMQRAVERALIFFTILGLTITLMLFMRRSVQKIALEGGDSGSEFRVTALFSVPVFLLLVLVGFSYIVYTAPITVIIEGERIELRGLEDDTMGSEPKEDARAVAPRGPAYGSVRRKALFFARNFRGQDRQPSGPLLTQLLEGGPAIETYLQRLVETAPSAVEILALSEDFDWVFDTTSYSIALENAIDERLR